MWLDNIKELKKSKGMSTRQIAEETGLPERTVTRIFSGDTDNPYVDTLHRIVVVLGGSLDDILADTKVVVGDADLVTLRENVDEVTAERNAIIAERDAICAARDLLVAENAILNDKIVALTSEIDLLKMQLKHKEEIVALHNYYMKQRMEG